MTGDRDVKAIDVCVIGAGPAGCFAAYHLAQAGLHVVVLEEHAEVGRPVDCSGIIGVEAFSVLGLPRSSIVDELRRIELIAPSGATLAFNPASTLAYVVDRAAFDQSLADLAVQAGARIQTSSVVTAVEVERHGVRITMRHHDQPRVLEASATILAGGPRYQFQERLGMGHPRRILVTMQAEVELPGRETPKVFFGRSISPGSFAWFLPVCRNGRYYGKIGISVTGQQGRATFRQFLTHLHERGLVNGQSISPRGWIIPIQPLPRTFTDRVVAVGDAAGQTKPTTGGGLYYGLLCARVAAETLVEATARGDLSADSLAVYEQRWKQLLGRELKTMARFRRFVERLSDEELNGLFTLALRGGIVREIEHVVRFDWHGEAILKLVRMRPFLWVFLKGLLRPAMTP